jgi:hypothetical protein
MRCVVIYKDEKYIQLAEFDDTGEIRFTSEFLAATKAFPGARKFASQLISHWGPEYTRMLDYFGPDDAEQDIYTCVDGDPMACREDIPDLWSYKDLALPGLEAEWYRDMMHAKLVSLRIPERLVAEYVKAGNKSHGGR